MNHTHDQQLCNISFQQKYTNSCYREQQIKCTCSDLQSFGALNFKCILLSTRMIYIRLPHCSLQCFSLISFPREEIRILFREPCCLFVLCQLFNQWSNIRETWYEHYGGIGQLNSVPQFLIPTIGNKNIKLMKQGQHLLLAPDLIYGNIPWKNTSLLRM